MAKTYTFTVSNVAKTAIVVQSVCKRILVREDPGSYSGGAPTQGYNFYAPTSTDLPAQILPGERAVDPIELFPVDHGYFQKGDIAGYLLTLVSPTTFQQIEL